MINSYFKAQLASLRKINVFVFSDMPRQNEIVCTLYTNDAPGKRLNLTKSVSQGPSSIFEFTLDEDIVFGKHYLIGISSFPCQPLDVSSAVYFPEFDEMFNYDGDDLGAIYSKEETKFNLWAPLASDVFIKLENAKGGLDVIQLKRSEHGVYRTIVKGDLLNRKYHYVVENSGCIRESNDPYGKGVSVNSLYSAVVDIEAIKKMPKIKPISQINKPIQSIIYETNVRDFTEDKNTDIVNKGKYLGFVEENRKTKGGNPAGIDYLKYLGISHVQLNPIIDFAGVDDLNPLPTYNWGYDPLSFFSIEGSYSNDPNNPMSRLFEFREMIDKLHASDIRVVMDVVYNHLYGYMDSCFERILPNYFFRRRKDHIISSASGCGDDFASERYMARKAIVDSIKYFSEYFDIDGYRFDLMGLIDIDTINECVKESKKIKSDTLIYGEGWNMGYELPFDKKACSENYSKLPDVGFFNPTFRDIVKGPTFDKSKPGYVCGDASYSRGVEFALTGSVLNYTYHPMFLNASQSINYVECHDNQTLFDKICECHNDEDTEIKLKRVKLANAILLLSFGVPFIHMGQEFGQTKHLLDNTYNVPKINNMDWKMVDQRFDYVNFVKELIKFRKLSYYTTNFDTPEDIDRIISFYQHYDDSTFYAYLRDKDEDVIFDNIILAINPNTHYCDFDFEDDYELIVGPGGFPLGSNQKIIVNRGKIPPLSLYMVGKRK